MIKNLPAMPETWIQSLGGEGALEKRTTTFSCFLACRIPWTEEPDSQWDGIKNSRIQLATFIFTFLELCLLCIFRFIVLAMFYSQLAANFLLELNK